MRYWILAAALMVGCTQPHATMQDRRQVEQLHALMEAAPELARELVNNNRPDGQYRIAQDALLGQATTKPITLDAARARVAEQISLLTQAATWPAPPSLPIARASAPITIDGRPDESAWNHAASVPVMNRFNSAQTIRPKPAAVKLLWDDRYLYAAFQIDKWPIMAQPVERDGQTYAYDCAELFLMGADVRWNVYWEFNVTAKNDVYDSMNHKFFNRDGYYARTEENARGLKSAVAIREGEGYSVEITIPWDQAGFIQQSVGAGTRLRLLLAIADRDNLRPNSPVLFYAHTPVLGSFHNIWGWSPAVLVD